MFCIKKLIGKTTKQIDSDIIANAILDEYGIHFAVNGPDNIVVNEQCNTVTLTLDKHSEKEMLHLIQKHTGPYSMVFDGNTFTLIVQLS